MESLSEVCETIAKKFNSSTRNAYFIDNKFIEHHSTWEISRRNIFFLSKAIAEHRWRDALHLLPITISLGSTFNNCNGMDPSFLWKAVHLVLLKNGFCQDEIVSVTMEFLHFLPSYKKSSVILNWFSETLPNLSESNMEDVMQGLKKNSTAHRLHSQHETVICDAFLALHYFLKWKKSYSSLNLNDNDGDDEFYAKLNNYKKQGARRLKSLEDCLSSIQNLQPDTENESRRVSMCDWIVAPILTLQQDLNKLGLDEVEIGLDESNEIFKKYLNENEEHLPTIRMSYDYIHRYYPENKKLLMSLLTKIASLCPEDSLTLELVNVSMTEEENITVIHIKEILDAHCSCMLHQCEKKKLLKKARGSVISIEKYPGNEYCLLKDYNLLKLIKCVRYLVAFLEFAQRQCHEPAWDLFKNILLIFHKSWLNCWKCLKCRLSRHYFKRIGSKLSLWPSLFWKQAQHIDGEEHSSKLIGIGYSAYLFGYDSNDALVRDTVKQSLESNRKKRKTFKRLMKLDGLHSTKVKEYISNQSFKWNLVMDERKSLFSATFESDGCLEEVSVYSDDANETVLNNTQENLENSETPEKPLKRKLSFSETPEKLEPKSKKLKLR